jgi:hypothetical protein
MVPVSCGREHTVVSFLDQLYVLCLKAFRAFRDIELYLLAFSQPAEAAPPESPRNARRHLRRSEG